MKHKNKKKKSDETRLLPYNKPLLIPEKTEADFHMSLTPVLKPYESAKYSIVIRNKQAIRTINTPANTLRPYSGKSKQGKLLRVCSHTFKFRMLTDSSFHSLIMSNRYVYVQGYLILAPIAYEILKRRLSMPRLLEEPLVRHNLREFMMQEVKKQDIQGTNLTELATNDITFRAYGGVAARIKHSSTIKNSNTVTDSIASTINYRAIPAPSEAECNAITTKKMAALFDTFQHMKASGPPQNFRAYFEFLTKGYDVYVLEEMTGISYRTIERIKNERGSRPQLQQLVAICLAVNALPTETVKLVELAGLQFRETLEEQTYLVIINTCYMFGVAYCNKLLFSLGVKPLTKLGLS